MGSFVNYLLEMGDTTAGKAKLAGYISKAAERLAKNAAEDGLSAGVNLKHDGKTVIGLDKEHKPIYQKDHPKFDEKRHIDNISKAAARLAKH